MSSPYVQPYAIPSGNYYARNPNYHQNHHHQQQHPQQYTYRSISIENHLIEIHKHPYIFDRKLATGRFSSIYAAHRRSDNKPVAIKVLSLVARDSREISMIAQSFINEIRMTKRLTGKSNHIVDLYDFDFHQTGLSFLVMELGYQDLEKYLSQRSALLSTEKKGIWRQLVNIVVTLQNSHIMHLNISPDNLILFYGNIIKLTDFGIAQKVNEPRSLTYGTPPYSAPELTIVSRHHAPILTTKADIWSLGAILYRMIYMTPPDYIEPCYRPPPNQNSVHDSYLSSILRHTLLIDAKERSDALWLSKHPYTTTV
ncbi:hypothetical protein I4U23_023687 [Adineta vaga]|nr:hypothetical protein I4U23_023687 [Adineta vaga]